MLGFAGKPGSLHVRKQYYDGYSYMYLSPGVLQSTNKTKYAGFNFVQF